MIKTKLLLILLAVAFFSCNSPSQTEENNDCLNEVENSIIKEAQENFEKALKAYYKSDDLNEMYLDFLNDFSEMKSRKNPYASKLKKPVTIRLGEDVITYFKDMADDTGVPYQNLINLYFTYLIP